MEMKPVLVFDMDGVLVDVTASYRETIRETVRFFTGQDVTQTQIQDFKNAGGWNNDWALSHRLCTDLGADLSYETVVQQFQVFFFGANGHEGLILRERWLPESGLLARLAERFHLAIFTGRLRNEADFTLDRFAHEIPWSKIVSDSEVTRPKPAPDGLLQIAQAHPGAPLIYLGDTVDDARSARDAGTVRFIGIAANHVPERDKTVRLLRSDGADAVLENINQVESVL